MSVHGVPNAGMPSIPTAEDRQMGLFSHIGGGFFGFLVPVIIMATKGNESQFVKDQSTEALNFQLTMLIGYAIATVLAIVTCGIGAVLFFVPWILGMVFGVIGGMAANKGEWYRYPFNIRMVK